MSQKPFSLTQPRRYALQFVADNAITPENFVNRFDSRVRAAIEPYLTTMEIDSITLMALTDEGRELIGLEPLPEEDRAPAFVRFVMRCQAALAESGEDDQLRMHERSNRWDFPPSPPRSPIPHLYVEWETGGISGGSWTGSEATGYVSSNVPAELTSLDTLLEVFHPTMTFLQYKALTNKLTKTGDRRENEYYGNHTDYAWRRIDLRDLYDYLKGKGWLPHELQ